MNLSYINSTLPSKNNQEDSLKRNLESMIFMERKNVLLINMPNIKEYLKLHFGSYNDDFVIVHIDLSIDDKRDDCIEQILNYTKKQFPENSIVQNLFNELDTKTVSHTRKDEIFYSFFKELSKNRHFILVMDYFNQYADFINETDYHRLTRLHEEECEEKVSFVIVMENDNLALLKKTFKRQKFLDTFDNIDNSLFRPLPHKNIIYETKMNTPEIFISYAWGGESETIVDEICQCLDKNNLKYCRDKKDICYKDNIIEFEERLGRGSYIILVVDDKFLKSKNCMYEVLQIKNAGNIYGRIFPIVLEDAKIYDPVDLLDYVKYWEGKQHELDAKLKTVSVANLSGLRNDIDNYTEYRRIISEFVTVLRQMNTSSIQSHRDSNFSVLMKAIEQEYEKDFLSNSEKTLLPNEISHSESKQRHVSQHGNKSIYIENNSGNITVN